MFEKLVSTVEKYDRLEYELANNTALITDASAYAKAIKEYRSLTPVVEKYREYKRAESDISDALQIIDESDDADMRELAQDELKAAKSRLEALAEEYGLVKTGGSDFHGENKPRIKLGYGIDDNLSVPYSWLEELKKIKNT